MTHFIPIRVSGSAAVIEMLSKLVDDEVTGYFSQGEYEALSKTAIYASDSHMNWNATDAHPFIVIVFDTCETGTFPVFRIKEIVHGIAKHTFRADSKESLVFVSDTEASVS